MWTASFYLGNFIGPTVSGFLVDAYGFAWTSGVFFGIYGLILIIDTCDLLYTLNNTVFNNETKIFSDTHSEKSPLSEQIRMNSG